MNLFKILKRWLIIVICILITNTSVSQEYKEKSITTYIDSIASLEKPTNNILTLAEKKLLAYDTITLERGVSYDNDFNEWMSSVCNVQGGGDIPSGGGPDFGANSYRKSVKITLYNKQGVAVKEFKLINAFPSEYEVGDLDATSNDVLISTLVLQHHGIIETNLAS